MGKLQVKLKLKRGLLKSEQIAQLIVSGIDEVKKLEQYEQYKLDQMLTKRVMKAVLASSKTVEGEVDKSAIVREILTQVFKLNKEEVDIIDQQISYIIDEGIHSNFFYKIVDNLTKMLTGGLKWVLKH